LQSSLAPWWLFLARPDFSSYFEGYMTKLVVLSPLELYNLLQDGGRDKLIVDLRPTEAWRSFCIRTALSYPWETTFATRQQANGSFELNGLAGKKVVVLASSGNETAEWVEKEDKSFGMRGLVYPTVVLYDERGAEDGRSYELANFFAQEGKFKSVCLLEGTFCFIKNTSPHLTRYQGGFVHFEKSFRFVCTSIDKKLKALDGSFVRSVLFHRLLALPNCFKALCHHKSSPDMYF